MSNANRRARRTAAALERRQRADDRPPDGPARVIPVDLGDALGLQLHCGDWSAQFRLAGPDVEAHLAQCLAICEAIEARTPTPAPHDDLLAEAEQNLLARATSE